MENCEESQVFIPTCLVLVSNLSAFVQNNRIRVTNTVQKQIRRAKVHAKTRNLSFPDSKQTVLSRPPLFLPNYL